jgi:hypothetical protein
MEPEGSLKTINNNNDNYSNNTNNYNINNNNSYTAPPNYMVHKL